MGQRGRKAKSYGFEELALGEWLNIPVAEHRSFAQAIWRYAAETGKRFCMRKIDERIYRIVRYD